jgi:hypothetical protein
LPTTTYILFIASKVINIIITNPLWTCQQRSTFENDRTDIGFE